MARRWKPCFEVSTRLHKKYSVITPRGRKIHFGDNRYEHYYDRTPLPAWSHLDHKDTRRRAAYRSRHGGVRLGNGRPAYLDPESPAYYSWHYLW